MDYSNELNLLLKEINFADSKILRSNFKGGYFVILGNYHGDDVILRTAPIGDLDKIARFKREYEASKILASFNSNSKSSIINFTEVIDIRKSKGLYWSIRSYSKDQTLAIDERYNQAMIHGYDIIRQKFVDSYHPIVKNIINIVGLIQKIDINAVKEGVDIKLFTPRLEKDLKKIDIKKIERLLDVKFDSQINFYKYNSDEYSDKSNIRANMGDLIPPNIIVSPNNQITLYDYEWFCFDNYIVDYSSLWLFFWRYPKWQNAISKKVLITEKNKMFFSMSLIRELISWYAGAFSISEKNKLKRRVNFYKKHIWLKYLKATGESFESIMKVKADI